MGKRLHDGLNYADLTQKEQSNAYKLVQFVGNPLPIFPKPPGGASTGATRNTAWTTSTLASCRASASHGTRDRAPSMSNAIASQVVHASH